MAAGFQLLQISDPHWPAAPARGCRGVDSRAQLRALLESIRSRSPAPDHLVLSGDNVHDGVEADYRQLMAVLDESPCDWSWIPGNHDDAALMRRLAPERGRAPEVPGWHSAWLDTSAAPDNRGGGSLTSASLEAVRQAAAQSRPVLLVMHHNPLPVESPWQDPIGLGNAADFWEAARGLPEGSLVLCGHVHQVWEWQHQGCHVLSCPSSAVQFRPRTAAPVIEREGPAAWPGFRWLELDAEGGWRTGVERLPVLVEEPES